MSAVVAVALTLVTVPVLGAGASASKIFPTVKGGYGVKPKITFPATAAPKDLEVKVLHEGNGPKVKKHDLLVTNFYGQLWRGKVFDTSFGSTLFPTPIGVGAVLPGWDDTLPGLRVGSRVLLVIPPKDAYGSAGETGAGIPANATLVFVVDLVATYSPKVEADPHATVVHQPPAGITVTGKLGSAPKVKVKKGTPKPTAEKVIVLARGNGKKLKAGIIIDQFVAAKWSGGVYQSTFAEGTPDGEPIGQKSSPSALDDLIGIPIGSRVLMELPKNSTGGPYAIVFDIVAQPTT